jgi:hypothetical protein
MGSTTSADTDRLRAYAPGDEVAIQSLFNDVFARDRSDAAWAWRFRDAPDGPALIHVVERDGRIVAHTSNVGFRTHADGGRRRILVAHSGDLLVVPEHRGKGLMRRLTFAIEGNGYPFHARLSFPTDQAARYSEGFGGGRLLGRLPQWARASRPTLAARRTTGPARLAAFVGTAALRTIARFPSRTETTPAAEVSSEYDELAAASARFARFVRVRDAGYVRWRWLDQPDRSWHILEARRRGELRGWAVFGLDHDDGSLGRIVDLLCLDGSSARALLVDAARRLEARAADRVVLDLQDPRPWVDRACLQAGFVRYGTGLNVFAKALTTEVGREIEDLGSWYLTRGDSDLA